MAFSFPQIAALIGIGCVVIMLIYVAALRSQYRLAEAERKRTNAAEAQLKEEQRLSRSMMDNTSDLMAIYRIEGDRLLISEWNPALRRFYSGREPEVNIGLWVNRPIDAFLAEVVGLDEEAIAKRLLPFRKAVAAAQPVAYSTTIPGAHGTQYRESLIVPLTDAQGRVTHLFYRASDVTGRRLSEDELRRSADQFAGMFNLVPNALAISRADSGRLLTVNDAWTRLFGWQRAEVLGRTAVDLGLWIDPADRAGFLATLQRDGRLRPTVNHMRARDGREVLCLTSANVIDWEGAQAILISHQDITEVESLRREAQALGERFIKLFHTSPVPTLITRLADGGILEMNQAYLDTNGYTRDELLGGTSGNLGMWIEPGDRAQLIAEIMKGATVRNRRMQFRNGVGEIRDYLYSAERIDWHGEAAVVSFPVDVTELEHAQRDLQKLTESLEDRVTQRTAALEAANRELESFSYSVSHDLRAPLRALSGFSGLLAAHPAISADAEAAGHARRINAAASRMGALVDALLQFARLSQREVAPRPVNLAESVESLIAELTSAAAGRRVRWVVGPLPAVRGDPALLRLVLQNLLDNALKYSRDRDETVIEIDATRGEGETVVRVKDNGVGFDMQYADKVFGVFERLHADSEFEGTGIGLASAQRIVQRHGGRIWCTAAPGEGAAFYFSLPD